MNAKEFYNAVVAMREAQKDMVNNPTPETVQKAQDATRIIDNEIRRVNAIVCLNNAGFHCARGNEVKKPKHETE